MYTSNKKKGLILPCDTSELASWVVCMYLSESIVNTFVTFIDGKQVVIIQVLTIWFLTHSDVSAVLMSIVKDKRRYS
jgi:hypothetical protein